MSIREFLAVAEKTELYEKVFTDISVVKDSDFIDWEMAVRYLESKGFVIGAVTKNFPEGVYISEGLENNKLKGWGLENEIPEKLVIQNIGKSFKTLKPEAPETEIQGLKLVPHHTMGILFCHKDQWQKVLYVPYGVLGLAIADTTGIQYGQSAFEGCCAMRNKNSEIFGYRLDENSKRFDTSIKSLDLAGINIPEVEAMIEKTISYNKQYVPKNKAGKLYIRPSVSGLNGGLGIILPDFSVITVEVAAFGDYLPESIKVEGIKSICRPSTGSNKIAPNYGASFKIKHGVKDRGYNDFLSFDKDGNTEEVASCAIGFIDENNNFVIPPVLNEIDKKERNILPSITRKSVIEILKSFGEKVIIRDVPFDEIQKMKGCYTMGNAVGVLKVSHLCLKNNTQEKGEILNFDTPEITEKIFSLRDKVYAARTGDLKGFESWAKKIK